MRRNSFHVPDMPKQALLTPVNIGVFWLNLGVSATPLPDPVFKSQFSSFLLSFQLVVFSLLRLANRPVDGS